MLLRIYNSHLESPAEFGLLVLGGDQVVGHDELLEVEVAVAVSVQGPEQVITIIFQMQHFI